MLIRLLESFHGHLGVLGAAALLHPAILLRHGKPLNRRNRWSVALTAVVATLAFGSGLFIYPHYTSGVKQDLFYDSARAGLLFETKEHLAFVVICLTLGGAVAAWIAPPGATALRRAAALLFSLAFGLCLVTAGLGTYVASVRGFWAVP
jgi:hypothetical protein